MKNESKNRIQHIRQINPSLSSLYFLRPSASLASAARSASLLARARAPPSRVLRSRSRASRAYFAHARLLFPHQIATKRTSRLCRGTKSPLLDPVGAAVLDMSRPPRPRVALTGETGVRQDAAMWSCPVRQVAQGFEEVEAIRGDGAEFADDMS